MNKRTVLIADTNNSSLALMAQQLEQEGYGTVGTSSLDELDQILQKDGKYSIVLIDLSGFDPGIWERCARMKEAKLPFLVLAPQRSPTTQRDCVKYGAAALLVKPVGTRELIEHIKAVIGD